MDNNKTPDYSKLVVGKPKILPKTVTKNDVKEKKIDPPQPLSHSILSMMTSTNSGKYYKCINIILSYIIILI